MAGSDLEQLHEAPVWHGLIAGATSGLAARLVTFPADTLKARLQIKGAVQVKGADAEAYSSTSAAARHMLRVEGPVSFYQGFGAVLWGIVPANFVYFGGYELGKKIMPVSWGPTSADLATGAFAQVLAGLVYTPIDIVKERMQVQGMLAGTYSYASPLDAFRSVIRQGQGVHGLFKGYWATNCVWLPWNALYVAGYEQLKRHCSNALGCDVQQLQPWAVASCSATAAAAAAVVTHPFDVVKTRLQVLSAQQSQHGLTAVKVAEQQLYREGVSSFMHGLTARLLNIAPGCALSWAMYEYLKRVLHDLDG
eukprot:GHRR01010291.1.p1 GENE.GHRR01010291.1~~GHRR01010291.1.p1  ORF type:complete len:308 (+),score=68.28 GHRR01010291.1:334-1257(+)